MTRLPGGSTGILYLAVVLTATIASLAATAFHTVRADESSPPDPAIILIASETPTQRDLRFIRGLIDLRLYDMAANEAVKLIGRLSQSSATAEKNSPENVIVQTEAISLAIKATTSLWVLSDQAGQGRLEKSVVDLRRMVEGNQATESVFVWPESGDVSAYLRYAASILNDATSRAAVLRCQNQNSKAVEILQPLAGFDVPQWTTQARTTQARTTDDWNLGISPVERIMEYLFAFEQFREETILCGMVPRSTPRKALPNFASRLTPAEAAVFDAFVKYIDLRAARFDGRREEAAACLTALAENKVARFIPGIEAERLRLAILNGKAKEHFASTVQEFGKEAPFVQPLQDDMLTRALDDDRQFARFEFLLAIGKEKQSGPDIQQRITRQLEVVKSSCSPLVSRQVETLLGISGQRSSDAGMTETAAESAWRDGRIDEAISLYDAASARALAANKRADAFRLAAAAAAILRQRLESNGSGTAMKSDTAAQLDLLNRFIRLGREFREEKQAIDFMSAGLDWAMTLLKSGNLSFDEYLKLRIEFLICSADHPQANSAQHEDFRFRTIALALGNHRAEPAILLLKENPACQQVSQAVLGIVVEGIKRILFGEEILPETVSLREVAELFLLWDGELKKDRRVPLHWSDRQSRTLELSRARALYLTGQVAEAFNQFASLLKTEPGDQDVLISLATILSERTTDAEIDRAIELWSRVIAGSVSSSAKTKLAREQLVILLKRRGRNVQADKLRRLIDLEKGEIK